LFKRVLSIAGLTLGAFALWSGLEYYLTPLSERPFSPLHDLYAPTGLVGHGFGIIGTFLMLGGVVMYSARKRLKYLAGVGKLKYWLEFHIFLCLLGPFLVLLHTTFKFGGIVAISFWSMALVVGSGVFGRYVYVWIPKTVNGRFLTVREVEERRGELISRVEEEVGIEANKVREILGDDAGEAAAESKSILGALAASMRFRLRARSERDRMGRSLAAVGVPAALRDELMDRLQEEKRGRHQLMVIRPFQRAFRYWHAFHLPLAVVMILILVVHVAVAVAFGYTWVLGSS